MVYTIDVVKSNIAEALEVLSDAVLNPKFNPWEVKEQVAKMEADLKNVKNNPQTVLLEVRFLGRKPFLQVAGTFTQRPGHHNML